MTPTAPFTQAAFVASQVANAVAAASVGGVAITDGQLQRLRTDSADYYQSYLLTLSGYPVSSVFGDQSPAR